MADIAPDVRRSGDERVAREAVVQTAVRDDERAAAACGVPVLGLKLVATSISGALMGMAGAPFPFYISIPYAELIH